MLHLSCHSHAVPAPHTIAPLHHHLCDPWTVPPLWLLFVCSAHSSHIIAGVWPEFALLNHSCAPNTVPPVLLRDRLLLRSALSVPAGEELTTSYLDVAGGLPLQQRRGLLQANYGFTCNCHRCKVIRGRGLQLTQQAQTPCHSIVQV